MRGALTPPIRPSHRSTERADADVSQGALAACAAAASARCAGGYPWLPPLDGCGRSFVRTGIVCGWRGARQRVLLEWGQLLNLGLQPQGQHGVEGIDRIITELSP